MRTLLMLISILLLNTSWATAQLGGAVGGAYGAYKAQQAANQAKDTVSSLAGTNATVQGCLSKEGASYTLTDSAGKSYALTGKTSQLASSVGHTVQVTGTASSSVKNVPGAIAGEAEGMKHTLKVSSFKNISNTCAP